MAGDWIKMRGNLWDDPRVSRLCDLTSQSEAAVIGGLYWLWAAADQHTENGVMLGLSMSSINRKTGIKKFADALLEIGWIADHPEGIRIVRFEEHNGVSAKRRCTDAQRKANGRGMSASDADKSRTDTGHEEDEKRRISELEKEKRREEKKEETHTQETPPVSTQAGAVCVLLKSKGIGIVNPGNQKLINLLEAGAHIGAFDAAADLAKSKGMGFAYVLGIVENEMTRQDQLAEQALAAPRKSDETPYQRAARERIAEFAPALAKKSPGAEITIIDGWQNVAAIGSR